MDLRDESIKPTLKVVSVAMIAIGGLMVIAFFADMASGFNTSGGGFGELDGGMPNIGLAFIGMPLLGIGGTLAKFAFLSEVTGYVAKETAPAARTLIGAALGRSVDCAKCGTGNDADASFCSSCGAAMQRACPSCSTANAGDARFCDHCGAALRV